MHFSWAVLLPGRKVGDLCLPHLPRFVLHNSYLRSHDGCMLFRYDEVGDDIFADFCLLFDMHLLLKISNKLCALW